MSNPLPSHSLIRKLVEKNRLIQACQVLIKTRFSLKGHLLTARINKLEEQLNTGQITQEEYSSQFFRISKSLLVSADKLEELPSSRLFARSGIVLVLFLGLSIFLWDRFMGPQCSHDSKYSILIADFSENKVFSELLENKLSKTLENRDSVHTQLLGDHIDRVTSTQEEQMLAMMNNNCLDSGLFIYGNISQELREEFITCYIKVKNLVNPVLTVKKENDEVEIYNFNTPEKINFTISEQAEKVKYFTVGLLKYYWGEWGNEGDAIDVFGTILTDSTFTASGTEGKHFLNYVRLLLANSYVYVVVDLACNLEELKEHEDKLQDALDLYDTILEEQPEDQNAKENKKVVEQIMNQYASLTDFFPPSHDPPADTGGQKPTRPNPSVNLPVASDPDSGSNPEPKPVQTPAEEDVSINDTPTPQPDPKEEQAEVVRGETIKIEPQPIVIPKPEMIAIQPEKVFWMGSTGSDNYSNEKPRHKVKLSPFFLASKEVTNEQFCDFLNKEQISDQALSSLIKLEKSGIKKSNNEFTPIAGREEEAVTYVTWYGAVAYCQSLGYRLPTEAEWEYARKNPNRKILGMGERPGEWCSDWFNKKYYKDLIKEGIATDPQGPDKGKERVYRLGYDPTNQNSIKGRTHRSRQDPEKGDKNIGFRPAADKL